MSWDESVLRGLHRVALSHPGLVTVARVVSDAGQPTVWRVAGLVLIGWFLWQRLFRVAAFVTLADGGSLVLSSLIKVAVHRPRPVLAHPVAHAGGWSFPSGHALTAAAAAGVMVVLLRPVLRRGAWVAVSGLAYLIAAIIGLSRLFLGLHYLSDVLGGFVIAGLWIAVSARWSLTRRQGDRRRARPRAH